MTETPEPTREQIVAWAREIEDADWREDATIGQQEHVLRLAIRTLDAEAQLRETKRERDVAIRDAAFFRNARDREIEYRLRDESKRDEVRIELAAMTERAESYKAMALSAARRVRDIHTIVCGEDDSLSPREQHEAIVDVLRGHHALGPWTAAEADLARKIASDPCVVSKRWPGGSVEHARIVGEEAERAERSHRTLCGDSAQFLLKKAIPWIAAMTERAEKAERERDVYKAGHDTAMDDIVMRANEYVELRAKLAEVERERDEARSRIVEQIKKSLPHAMENAKAVYKYDGNESRARAMAVLIVDEALQCLHFDDVQEDLRTKLATATPNASAPATDARLDCESSSLLLLSTWARKVMMRPKNRDKGLPSESVEELIVMARRELTEARDAIEESAPTDDILAELGDAAACIAFAMREVEKRRKA